VVEPYHLLTVSNDARLTGCSYLLAHNYPGNSCTNSRKFLDETPASLIAAHDATCLYASAQSSDVSYHIAGTASMSALACDPHDRDWCLWRDPFYSPPDVAIKHQVADNQDSDLRETLEYRG
jgi:hypothetical protein